MDRSKRKAEAASRAAVKLAVPPTGRARYELVLPANAELVITCVGSTELCTGREGAGRVRVWTRALQAGLTVVELAAEAQRLRLGYETPEELEPDPDPSLSEMAEDDRLGPQ